MRTKVIGVFILIILAVIGVFFIGGNHEEETLNNKNVSSFFVLEGTVNETEYFVIDSSEPGPTVMVVGGVHGNETSGWKTAEEVLKWDIDKGKLVVIPHASTHGVENLTRTGEDGKDLNRQFPLSEAPTSPLAEALWNVVAEHKPAALLDLHEGFGIYGKMGGSVGQSIVHSGTGDSNQFAHHVMDYLNEFHVSDIHQKDYKFSILDMSNPMIAHKTGKEFNVPAFIAETTTYGTSIETRIRWQKVIVQQFLKWYGVLNEERSFKEIDHRPKIDGTIFTSEKILNARSNIEKHEWAKELQQAAVSGANPYLELPVETLIKNNESDEIRNMLKYVKDAYLYTGNERYAETGVKLLEQLTEWYEQESNLLDKDTQESLFQVDVRKQAILAYDAFYSYLQQNDNELSDEWIRTVLQHVKDGYYSAGGALPLLAAAAVVINEPDGFTKEAVEFLDVHRLLLEELDQKGQWNKGSLYENLKFKSHFVEMADYLHQGYEQMDLYSHPKFRQMVRSDLDLIIDNGQFPMMDNMKPIESSMVKGIRDRLIQFHMVYSGLDPVFAQGAYILNGSRFEDLHGDIFMKFPMRAARSIKKTVENSEEFQLASTNLTNFGFSILRERGEVEGEQSFGLFYDTSDLQVEENTVPTKMFSSGALQLEANKEGEQLSVSFEVPKTDQYRVVVPIFTASSYGIYQWKIDDEEIDTADHFGSGEEMIQTEIRLSEGKHTITFMNQGKNEDSSNYKMALFGVRLLDTQDQENQDELDQMKARINQGQFQREIYMNYGKYDDALDIGIHAFGKDLTQGLLNRNTVTVDRMDQQSHVTGRPLHFDDSRRVKLIDVDMPQIYSQTDVYRRTIAWVKADQFNSYAVDIFNIAGGAEHTYSFHEYETEGSTKLSDQPLREEWHYEADVHLKLTQFKQSNKDNNMRKTTFASIFEPYQNKSFIKSVEAVTLDEVRILKVTLLDGRTDYIVHSTKANQTVTVYDQYAFQGFFGVLSVIDGEIIYEYALDGEWFDDGEGISASNKGLEGEIIKYSQGTSLKNEVIVSIPSLGELSSEDLIGKYIWIDHERQGSSMYQIHDVNFYNSNQYVLDLGNQTLLRNYQSDTDEWTHYVKEGTSFHIPIPHERTP